MRITVKRHRQCSGAYLRGNGKNFGYLHIQSKDVNFSFDVFTDLQS